MPVFSICLINLWNLGKARVSTRRLWQTQTIQAVALRRRIYFGWRKLTTVTLSLGGKTETVCSGAKQACRQRVQDRPAARSRLCTGLSTNCSWHRAFPRISWPDELQFSCSCVGSVTKTCCSHSYVLASWFCWGGGSVVLHLSGA